MQRPPLPLLIAALAFFWCIGVFILLPRMEDKLLHAAQSTLEAQKTLQGRLSRVELHFDSQTAIPTGKVRSATDARILLDTLQNEVRAPTLFGAVTQLNPVASVRSEVEIAPFPAGWLLLAVQGDRAQLRGIAATEYEARDITRSLADAWSESGMRLESSLQHDSAAHDEAAGIQSTLTSLPIRAPDTSRVELHLARIGAGWEKLPLHETEPFLRSRASAAGISDAEWTGLAAPLIEQMQRMHAAATQREAERVAREKLPPAHLFIAVRGQDILLRGEISHADEKRRLLTEALAAFPTHRVHDALRVDAQRWERTGLPPLTAALLPEKGAKAEGKAFHLCFGGAAWTALDWRGSRADPSWKKEALPAGFDAGTLRADNAALIDWLQGGSDPAVPASSPPKPAFIVLALLDGKALLAGRVAEPALHAQLLQALREAYGTHHHLQTDAFLISPQCEASADILPTTRSLPAHDAGVPRLAVARPGGPWQLLPLSAALLEPGGISRSGLLPPPLSANEIESAAADALEQLRAVLNRK
ncbi:MAG: hypothetical protein IPK32_08515 [Verrucomicrobiaceae bacterium]|nr:hypothetical protein [Verrucomicrobiaceae bacterium]